jgi:hypothetical protein
VLREAWVASVVKSACGRWKSASTDNRRPFAPAA